MVLLDDNFATIVAAVREGRRIYDNIRKFVRFVMGGNAGEIWTIAAAPLFGLPLPLLPIQILWVNLITDGLPGLALAVEPEEKNIMRRPPRPARESVFANGMWQHIVWVGLLIGAICIAIQAWAIARGSEHWQTMVFTALAFCQMYHVLAIRSERESTLAIGLFGNLPLIGAVALDGRVAARVDLRSGAQPDLQHASAHLAGARGEHACFRRSCSSALRSRSGWSGWVGSTVSGPGKHNLREKGPGLPSGGSQGH